jgi:hypothetical protein
MLKPSLGHQLHAHANTQERRAGSNSCKHGILQAVKRFQPGRAIRERALPWQHDTVGPKNFVRVRCDVNGGADARMGSGDGEPARGGGQIAAGIVYDRDAQL